MGYSAKDGARPYEFASKASHHHIINDPDVQALLKQLQPKPRAEKSDFGNLVFKFDPPTNNPIQHIIAADGGYAEVVLEKAYPSRLMHFLQVGALYFRFEDLLKIEQSEFISPEDMSRLKNIERLKFALPTRNMRLQSQDTLVLSILEIVADFFRKNKLGEGQSLMDTLVWFLFRQYRGTNRNVDDDKWSLATNPYTGGSVTLQEDKLDKSNYTFKCPATGKPIRATDVFRLHEVIDEETGATGILGYLINVVEHIVLIHLIRSIINTQPELLKNVLFIKDGPCGFFGQTANLYKPMIDLIGWLQEKHNIFLVGLEKSGAFVEHAQEVKGKLNPGEVILLSNEYIYEYILPGQGDGKRPYGSTTNYGHKIIFKTRRGQMHVISVPSKELQLAPKPSDLKNLHVLLTNVEQLHCDMYDSALFPVALVNKLVSLSAHPSRTILQNFAKSSVG
jgi:hypothetical protein